MPITDLVAQISAAPQAQGERQVGESRNSKRNAYEAGKRAAQTSGMTEVELVLFIEGFRAGTIEKVIG